MTSKLIIEKDLDSIKITLNRPDKLNCMDLDMLEGIEKAIHSVNDDENVKFVLITGAGDKSFSTGGDLKCYNALKGKEIDHWIHYGNTVFNTIENCKKPVLADINGYAMGGGLELALACDFRICSSKAIFSMPEIYHGWLPGWGGMVRIKRLIGEAKAKELILLGLQIDTEKALQFGLVNEVYNTNKDRDEIISKYKSKLVTVKSEVYAVAKSLLLENDRKTTAPDLYFDIQSVHYFKSIHS